MKSLLRGFYSALMWLLQPLLRFKLARRARIEPGYAEQIEQRFGRYGQGTAPHAGYVWLHAVSLGETRAAVALVAQLRTQLPGMRLLITSGTATGRAEAARLLMPGDVQAWQPWDTPGATRRFLENFKPRIGILIETEIWPNLCAACERTGTPLVLANARLSEKSFGRTRLLGWLARPVYESLSAVWAQTEADAQRLARLGAPVRGTFGNIKFDARPDSAQLALGRAWRATVGRPVLMFASSRDGEEAALLQVLQKNKTQSLVGHGYSAIHSIVHDVQWLIVPRHPQRFDQVAQLIERHGFGVSRRSRWRHDGAPAAADLWLGDSVGEMTLYYASSDAALLGGSFEPLGGQNLIEAAACGCPVVMGPHTFNFAEAAQLALQAGAATRAPSIEHAVRIALDLVANEPVRQAVADSARSFASAHRDAADRTARAICELLVASRGSSAD